jgi:hypothetical protein
MDQATLVTALIHVHTTLSDGRGTAGQIARDANRTGTEVVIITDHDKINDCAGWQGDCLMLSGFESTPRRNHILVLGTDKLLPKYKGNGIDGDPARTLAAANAAGAFSAIAHPLDPPLALFGDANSYAGTDFSALDSTAMELLNSISQFKRGATGILDSLLRMFFPLTFLPGPHPVELALWDTIGRRRRWPAIAGADAHAFPTGRKWLPIAVYSYRRHMRMVTTGLWLRRPFCGDYAIDRDLVMEALMAGRCFCSLGEARGFSCLWHDPQGGRHWPGEELPFAPGGEIQVRLPVRGLIRLLQNGREVARRRGRTLKYSPQAPGVWRVEARRRRWPRGERPWIYANPFYLRRSEARA